MRGGREEFILQVAGLFGDLARGLGALDGRGAFVERQVQLLLADLELSHRFRERLGAIGHLLLHRGERLLQPRLRDPAATQFQRKQESRHDQDDGDDRAHS